MHVFSLDNPISSMMIKLFFQESDLFHRLITISLDKNFCIIIMSVSDVHTSENSPQRMFQVRKKNFG